MTTLYDKIIDAAEEIASNCLNHPLNTREEIAKAVSREVGENFSPTSPFGFLAEAAYNRKQRLISPIRLAG